MLANRTVITIGTTKLCNITNFTLLNFSGGCNTSLVSDGTYDVTANLYNGTQEENLTATVTNTNIIVDNNAPSIASISPENNHANKSANINFTYTPSDVLLHTCYLNGSWSEGINKSSNLTNNLINNSVNTFIVNGIQQGIFVWNITCNDSLGRTTTSDTRNLTIDWTAPVITRPFANGTEFNDGDSINCSCTATDNLNPSQTCTYSGTCNANNSGTSSVQRTIYLTAIDAAGNKAEDNVIYIVLPASTSGGSQENNEGAGGSEGSGAISKEHCWDVIEAGVTTNYIVDDPDIGISKITIIPKTNLTNACLNVKQVISITEANVPAYTDSTKVYKYFKIEPRGMTDNDLTSVIIEFSVSNKWLETHDKNSVKLNRYSGGWNALPTSEVEKTVNEYYFSATSPGFSSFVITGDAISTGGSSGNATITCGDGICSASENSTTCCKDCGCPAGFECKNNKCEKKGFSVSSLFSWIKLPSFLSNKFWFGWAVWIWILIGLVIIVAIVLIILFRKKIHLHFPFVISFSIKKRPDYGFR